MAVKINLIPTYANDVDGKLLRTADRLQGNNKAFLEQAFKTYVTSFGLVHSNPWGLTGQQVLDAFGTDVFAFLESAGKLYEIVMAGDAALGARLPTLASLGKKIVPKQDMSGVLIQDI